MKALLDNKFAPITFNWGFVESPFAQFSEAFVQWQNELHAKSGIGVRIRRFRSPLSESLLALQPLSTPQDRDLLVETNSAWTAIFSNGLRVNDVHSAVSYMPLVLKCRGLEVACVPDRSNHNEKDTLQPYGAVVFTLYGPEQNNWVNRIRHISVTNDVKGWEFIEQGGVQPFEQTGSYRKRKIVDRFTPAMLESYCAGLGIKLFNSDFYADQCLLVHAEREKPLGPTMSLAEAKLHVHV